MPMKNKSISTPISASMVTFSFEVEMTAERGGAQQHAGQDEADQRRLPQPHQPEAGGHRDDDDEGDGGQPGVGTVAALCTLGHFSDRVFDRRRGLGDRFLHVVSL